MQPHLYAPTTPTCITEKMTASKALLTQFPLKKQTMKGIFVVPNTLVEGGSPTLRSKYCENTISNNLITHLHPQVTSVQDIIQFAFKQFPSNRCIASKTPEAKAYSYKTYRQVEKERTHFGSGLMAIIKSLGVENHHLQRADGNHFVLAMFSSNCHEWLVTELSCMAYSITSTALYDTLGSESSAYILRLTQSPVMVLAKDKLERVLGYILDNGLLFVKVLIVIGDVSGSGPHKQALELAESLGIAVHTFAAVKRMGAECPQAHIKAVPEGIYTISFTSGTSGHPKGVVLSQQAVTAALSTVFIAITKPDLLRVEGKEFKGMCILPLVHVYQRLITLFELALGGTVYMPSNPQDIKQIMADLVLVKPTHLIGVPRLFNRIEASIMAKLQTSGWVTRLLYKRCVAFKKELFAREGDLTNHWLYDRQFTQKIKAAIGLDNVQLMITGSAPMLPESTANLRNLLNTAFLQGYGLTESFASICIPFGDDECLPVSSGYLMPTCEMRLVDCPHMNYTWKGNRSGEILLRGPQMALGYYKDPELTVQLFGTDGWFHTGDVGTVDDHGRLMIVDRVKDIFKLSQGEYVSPVKVESIYLKYNPSLLSQIYVHGESLKSFLVAVVAINENECLELLLGSPNKELRSIRYMDATNMDQLNRNKALRQFVLKVLNASVSKLSKLNGMERVKNICLFFNNTGKNNEHNPTINYGMTEEMGLVTPTLKVKRFAAKAFFRQQLEDMYGEGDITL